MLQKKWLIGGGLAAALVIALGAYFLFSKDDDERIIYRNLDRIVELAEKEGNESPFVTIGNSRDMLRYFSANPEVEVGPPLPLITDRRELEGVIIQVRQTLQSLSVRLIRRELTIAEDGQTAFMEVEAEANANYAGETGRERRQFTINWVKEDGEWVVQRVRLEGRDPSNFRF